MTRRERVGLAVVGFTVFVLAWHWAAHLTGAKVLPTPLAVLAALVELARSGRLLRHAGASLARVGTGFTLAALAGIPLGMLVGFNRAAHQVVNPVIQLLRPVSPLAWTPLAIVLFGVSDLAAVFLISLAAFFPIVVAAASAVRQTPPIYLAVGRNFGLTSAALYRRVVFPAALPGMIAGLRIALGVAWVVVVAAEMLAVESGLGYLIIDARNAGKRYDLVVAVMLIIGALGLGLDALTRELGRLGALRWSTRERDMDSRSPAPAVYRSGRDHRRSRREERAQ